jgi:hypothetical protein
MLQRLTWEALLEGLNEIWFTLRDQMSTDAIFSGEAARQLARLSRPVEPFNQPEILAPLAGIGGVLLGLVLSGVALASLGTLVVALLALALLLTRFYGVTLEVVALGGQ